MAKINIKVDKQKLIDSLQKAVDTRKSQIAEGIKARKEYEKAQKDFLDSLADLFRSGKGKCLSVKKEYTYRNETTNNYEIVVEFPASIKEPVSPEYFAEGTIQCEINEIENAIKLLKMSNDEVVGTATYSGVARYI